MRIPTRKVNVYTHLYLRISYFQKVYTMNKNHVMGIRHIPSNNKKKIGYTYTYASRNHVVLETFKRHYHL